MKSTGLLTESTGIDLASDDARQRLARDGYLFLRDFLPVRNVAAVEAAIGEAVAAAPGWLAEGTDPAEWRAGPSVASESYDDPDFWAMYRRVQSIQSFHEFAHHPFILSAIEGLLSDEVFVHSNHVARVVGPSARVEPTRIHQDWRPVQGAADTLTVWIPLADIPPPLGGLRLLEGSQNGGVVQFDPDTESICIDDDDDPRWRSASYLRGDVLIFHSLTVHAGLPNTTDRLRRSCEFRYQRVSDPAVVSTVRFPHWHPSIDWPELTEGWTSLASIEVPDFVEFEQLDDTAPHLPTPPSRLLGTA